ncbi:hypothetical protein DPMN_145307 [Dreissena polymorpha]|uniref:Uncharacterized protein n=1 Tax=Dreissena polymorpha TaxID=45954 RepID=A0A9D4F4V6_DREPO|nr:hypothetical protein DPMN_145307 [Dreissena polymorpha]
MGSSLGVTVKIKVINNTNCLLKNQVVTVKRGEINLPPKPISAGETGVVQGRKYAHTVTGSFGVVSWEVEGKDRRVVIMWSAPYNFNIYSNVLGVGMSKHNIKIHAPEWDNQMYKGSSNSLEFAREEYYYGAQEVRWEDDEFCVSGTMSTSHQAEVTVTVTAKSKAERE